MSTTPAGRNGRPTPDHGVPGEGSAWAARADELAAWAWGPLVVPRVVEVDRLIDLPRMLRRGREVHP